MSDTRLPDSNPPRKSLSLANLVLEKTPAKTSLGELYVRHARVSDLDIFVKNCDDKPGGITILSELVGRIKDKYDTTPLSDEEVKALTEADVASLANAIVQKNDWASLPEGHPLMGLEQLVKQHMTNQQNKLQETLESIRGSIDRDYGFLSGGVLAKLNEQVSGIAEIRSGLSFAALEALKRAGALDAMNPLGASIEALKRSGADLGGVTGAARAAIEAINLGDSWRGGLPHSLGENITSSSKLDALTRMGKLNFPQITIPEHVEIKPTFSPVKLTDTPVDLATIENAKNSRDVLEKITALVELTAGLSQTFVTEVLPAWFKQTESDAETARESLKHAAGGIRLAIVSIVISAFVSIGATVWQVSVTRDIDKEGVSQQKKTEQLLNEQLAMQRTLIERQTSDAEQLRQILRQQSEDAARRFDTARSAEKVSLKN